MSLKGFHIVFVTASLLLTVGCAVFAFLEYSNSPSRGVLIFALCSVIASIGLIGYGVYFWKKIKQLGL